MSKWSLALLVLEAAVVAVLLWHAFSQVLAWWKNRR